MQQIDTGTGTLLCNIDQRVATITLNKPEKRNALGDDLTPALREILLLLDTHPEVGCVVITGSGQSFCAGGDVSDMNSGKTANPGPAPSIDEAIKTLQHKQDSLTLRLVNLSKPTIAALPGAAAGAGMSIALACDLRIAAQSAFMTTAFARIGLSGDYGGSWTLTQLVGPAKAKELYFTGKRIYGEEGLALGLYNQVVADDDLAGATQTLAQTIANGPPIALNFIKQNINRAVTQDLKTCLDMEADRTVRCFATQDMKEAARAFVEKRQPKFSGR